MVCTGRIRRMHPETEYFVLRSPHVFYKSILADGNTAFLHNIIINLSVIAYRNGTVFRTVIS